jgi:hypothetical protein
MTIPWMMNCEHSTDGWCLDCVVEMGNERSDLRNEVERLKDELGQARGNIQECEHLYSVRGKALDRLREELNRAMEVVTDFWAMRAANIVGAEHPTINLDTIAMKVREILHPPIGHPDDDVIGPRTKMRRKAEER